MASQLVLALLTGVFAGALFSIIKATIPAPPNLPGVLGIVGIYLGYKGIEMVGVHVDLPEVLLKIF